MSECKYCHSELEDNKIRCSHCGRYNATVPESDLGPRVMSFSDLPEDEIVRICSKTWWAPILGKGIALRQLTIVGGPPGCGKSTWLIQLAAACAIETGKRSLIIPTEEDPKEIRSRILRLGYDTDLFAFPPDPQDETLDVLEDEEEFAMVGLDSIQDLVGDDPMDAVRALGRMKEYSMETDTPTFGINHVNKDDTFAGLNRLKHKVDTAILILGEETSPERRMMVTKNRFGQAHKFIDLIMTDEDHKFPGMLVPKSLPKKEPRKRTEKKN
jgi:predicted ATP-dependent serine protease